MKRSLLPAQLLHSLALKISMIANNGKIYLSKAVKRECGDTTSRAGSGVCALLSLKHGAFRGFNLILSVV